MSSRGLDLAYGVHSIANWTLADYDERVDVLKKHNVKILDTAFAYPSSEAFLGKYNAPKHFVIHTKAPALSPGTLSRQRILDGMEKSLKDLGVDHVDTYYLHSPDPATPIEESLAAIREIHKAGKFKHLGLSNFSPSETQAVHDVQARNNSVVPTIYQGNYNLVGRGAETELFPLLRKLGVSFHAYSPIAGGFLTKTVADLDPSNSNNMEGRFNPEHSLFDMHRTLYANNETLLTALEEWCAISKDVGISQAELAYRWMAWHSALKPTNGDGIVVGARTVEQLNETLTNIGKGPLDGEIVKKIENVWENVKGEAPVSPWENYIKPKVEAAISARA